MVEVGSTKFRGEWLLLRGSARIAAVKCPQKCPQTRRICLASAGLPRTRGLVEWLPSAVAEPGLRSTWSPPLSDSCVAEHCR